MRALILLSVLCCFATAQAQYKNTVWCFGDSARIDFINGNPLIKKSVVVSRGSCFSIARNTDSLLLYGQTNYKINPPTYATNLYSFNDSIMSNSDSLRGEGAYQELVLVNKPSSIDTFYLFQCKVADYPPGLYYSTVILNKTTGLGKVIKKNKKLNNLWQMDCINAVKHGNGKDWWIISRNWNQDVSQPYNSWQMYLVTENGIDTILQNVGSTCISNNTYSSVSWNGKRIAFISNMNIIEVYDFDRCTGLLSNAITIHAQIPFGGDANSGVEFSPSGRFLYVSDLKENVLSQFDLNAANIAASEYVVYDDTLTPFEVYYGMLKRAPDNKIYMTHWYIATGGAAFPYPPNFHNQYTDNLSVINYPDSAGAACGFSLCSFYLGGNRSYEGLPNNPNYEMGPDTASSCDTLGLAIQELKSQAYFKLFPNPAHDKIELELSTVLANTNCKIYIINSLGSIVKTLQSQFQNNVSISIANLPSGIYLLQVTNSKINATLKFVKE